MLRTWLTKVKKDGVWGRSVRASFNGTGLSCDPYACGDAWVNGACSSLSDFRPMTYESLHSKFCGGSLCFVRARKRGNAMRALVLGGGLLAVMCVCLLKAVLIYIYIHRQWTSLRFPKLLCCQ